MATEAGAVPRGARVAPLQVHGKLWPPTRSAGTRVSPAAKTAQPSTGGRLGRNWKDGESLFVKGSVAKR